MSDKMGRRHADT